jgi:hypothetical protein
MLRADPQAVYGYGARTLVAMSRRRSAASSSYASFVSQLRRVGDTLPHALLPVSMTVVRSSERIGTDATQQLGATVAAGPGAFDVTMHNTRKVGSMDAAAALMVLGRAAHECVGGGGDGGPSTSTYRYTVLRDVVTSTCTSLCNAEAELCTCADKAAG